MSPYSELVGPAKERGWRRRRDEEEFAGRLRREEDFPPKLPPKNMKTYKNLRPGSSLDDDFQVISASYILSKVNLKAEHSKPPVQPPAGNPQYPTLHFKNSRGNPSHKSEQLFKPGCGHKECVHCEYEENTITRDKSNSKQIKKTDIQKTSSRTSLLNPNLEVTSHCQTPPLAAPKLPPKPPWLSLPLPPPVPIPPKDITRVSNVSISLSSDSSEQETVIYGKNVKIERNNSHPENTSETMKYSNIGSDQASHTRKTQSICSLNSVQLFAESSVDLEKLTVRSYLEEMENEKRALNKKIDGCDKLLEMLCDRLAKVAIDSEVEKYKVHNKDVVKITALLYSLASRMAKYENCLEDDKASECEKHELMKKQEKLRSQLSEAKALKIMIEKRSKLVVGYLSKYLSSDDVELYKHVLSDKVSLIIELKEFEDRLLLSQKEYTSKY